MKILTTALLVGFAATGALAKGHNQGGTDVPGQGVNEQTITTSQALGGIKGQRPADKGPSDSPALENAGR